MDISNRIINLQQFMREKSIDAVLITKRENYIYFSGFDGTSAFLLITDRERILFTDSRYIEQASALSTGFEIVDYQGKLFEAVRTACEKLGVRKVGVESNHMSADAYRKYEELKLCEELVPVGNGIELLRSKKDEAEIAIIMRAVDLADRAFAHVLKFIRAGVMENEIAAEIEYFIKKNGARGPSFDTIVASGNRSSLPHGVASTKKIQQGDAIILDFGAILENYCSDMTRTVFLGEPSEEMAKVYQIVKEAQETAALKVTAGMTGREADLLARTIIETAGYGDKFGHGLGHGVGIEIHENPSLSPRSDTVLENGMVVTAEPGIYLPGVGGVRIEDMLVIRNNTPVILTKSTKEMIIL